MVLDSFFYTNKGGRDYNEDAVLMRVEQDSGIYVAADGLGGHQHGDVASVTVAEYLTESWDARWDGERGVWLEEQIYNANQKLLEVKKELNSSMKSTIAALVIDKEKAAWANVGDTRVYYYHDGELACVTEDHSVAYKKYKAGDITREEIGLDCDQSSLLRSLGGTDHCNPDIYRCGRLEPGDGFLLCSDGLWEYLYDEEIHIDYMKSNTAKDWAELLLLRVMERISDRSDNLSLITVMARQY